MIMVVDGMSRGRKVLRAIGAYILALVITLLVAAITGTEDASWFWGAIAIPVAVVIYRRQLQSTDS